MQRLPPRLARPPRIEAFGALSRPPKPPPRSPIPLCQWVTELFRRKYLSVGNALSAVLQDHGTGRAVQDQPLGEGGYRSALGPKLWRGRRSKPRWVDPNRRRRLDRWWSLDRGPCLEAPCASSNPASSRTPRTRRDLAPTSSAVPARSRRPTVCPRVGRAG